MICTCESTRGSLDHDEGCPRHLIYRATTIDDLPRAVAHSVTEKPAYSNGLMAGLIRMGAAAFAARKRP